VSILTPVTKLKRLFVIAWVVCRYRLDVFVPASALPLGFRILLALGPWHIFPQPKLSKGQRLRVALERLGPIFVKFGQILSTRRDLLPNEVADELRRLQDQVPPFDQSVSINRIEKGLGRALSQVFARFDEQVMASASIAQVHSAQLHNGKEVIVKVIRPDIRKTIRQDIALMSFVANLLETYWADGKRLHPTQVVKDYEKTIYDELDLQREAANASQLRRNFLDSELIYIPEIYWEYCSQNVLVMERVYGIPVADTEALRAANIDMKQLAERGVEIFFTQVFRDSFFHADMHPGNIFVSTATPSSPQYIAIDFGIVGTLSTEDQNYLARNLLAFFHRDYKEVAQLHVSSGWVPSDTRVDEFESAIRTVCEPIFERPLSEISFGHFLLRLFQTARRFDMEVQPQLVLLQKTLLNIEGLGRQLYPELDLWSTAKPYLENWMKQKLAPPGVLKNLRKQLPDLVQQSPELPKLIFDTMTHIRDLDLTQRGREVKTHELNEQVAQHKREKRKLAIGFVLVMAGLVSSNEAALRWLSELPLISAATIGLGLWFVVFS
jgi:ubiquinone biosynthesis protein